MSVKRTAVLVIAALAAAVATAPAASAATCTTSYLPLPADLPGGDVTAADSAGGYAGYGYVVGSGLSYRSRVLRWVDGRLTDLGQVPGVGGGGVVTGVNRHGTVVGWAAGPKAFRSRAGGLEVLPLPAGSTGAEATGVNDNGDIVGNVSVVASDTAPYRAYSAALWPADGSAPVKLAGLPTTGHTKATAIDQDGTVLVEHYPTRDNSYAPKALYLWKAGKARKLANPSDTTTVYGQALSNGRVVGQTYPASGTNGKGVLWDQDGTPSRPASSSDLSSINRSGQAVGWSEGTTGSYAVWQLNTLVAKPTSQPAVEVSADDGSLGGHSTVASSTYGKPTIWRCG